MTQIVKCWTSLAENVETLSSLVSEKRSEALSGYTELSIVQLGTQIRSLKTSFAEKQKLISEFDSLAPEPDVKNILGVKC